MRKNGMASDHGSAKAKMKLHDVLAMLRSMCVAPGLATNNELGGMLDDLTPVL